jgi:hypothetical protein
MRNKRCPFCFGTKLVRVIDKPTSHDQSLPDAIRKGQSIVTEPCPFCK